MLRVDCTTGAPTTTATNEMQEAEASECDCKVSTLSGNVVASVVMSEADAGCNCSARESERSGK